MNIKIKLLNDKAVVPSYQREGDAGLDLTATSEFLTPGYAEYGTSLAIEIPEGFVGLIFPRSSITSKTCFILGNSVGVIDSNYRGEIKFQFRHLPGIPSPRYRIGERIGQLIIVPIPTVKFEIVKELSETNRGEQGFGSSNEKITQE